MKRRATSFLILAAALFAASAPLQAQALTDADLARIQHATEAADSRIWEYASRPMPDAGRTSFVTKEPSLSEQVVTVGILVGFMVVLAGAGFCAVLACDMAQRWFAGERTIPKAQRDRINTWRLRQIGKGHASLKTALLLVPTESEMELEEAEIAAEIAAREMRQNPESTVVQPPAQNTSTRRQKGAPILIELVADAFKPNIEPPTEAFREIVATYCEELHKLVRLGHFEQVIKHFTDQEQRTHQSIKCACTAVGAMLDIIKHDVPVGVLGCRIKPELGRNDETAYRPTFFVELPTGRRPLQASDLMWPSVAPKSPEPGIVWPSNVLKIQFQDGEELEIASDLSFVGLDEEGFKTAYEAFTRTRAELFGTARAPELNSKIQQDIDRDNKD